MRLGNLKQPSGFKNLIIKQIKQYPINVHWYLWFLWNIFRCKYTHYSPHLQLTATDYLWEEGPNIVTSGQPILRSSSRDHIVVVQKLCEGIDLCTSTISGSKSACDLSKKKRLPKLGRQFFSATSQLKVFQLKSQLRKWFVLFLDKFSQVTW